jgi:antibiotic biosynthesis monooxygenase (ABM) superfamily enzyme
VKRNRQVALAVSALLLLGAVAEAQDEYVHSIIVTVKPSSALEFEDYAKKVLAAATKIGSPQRSYAFQLAAGGPNYTYIFSSPFSSFEEMGSWPSIPEALTKALGDVEGAKILKAGRATIETSETRVSRTMSELSTNLKPFDPQATPIIRLIRTEVDPAQAGAYEAFLAKVKSAQEKSPGYATTIRRVSALGQGFVYSTATYLKSLGDIDKIPSQPELMRKAFGEEGAKTISDSGNGAIRSREVWLLRYRPDLSRPTVTAPTTN